MASLVTVAEALAFMDIAEGDATQAQQAQAAAAVAGVSAAIARHCGRELLAAAYDEYYDGTGRDKLYLNQYPIIPVASPAVQPAVTYYDENGVATAVLAADFHVYAAEACLRLKPTATHSTVFLKGARNYRVEYKAGYAALPDDIKLAALTWAAAVFQRAAKKAHAIESKSVRDRSVSFRFDAIPPEVAALLEPHVRPPYA